MLIWLRMLLLQFNSHHQKLQRELVKEIEVWLSLKQIIKNYYTKKYKEYKELLQESLGKSNLHLLDFNKATYL